MKNKSNTKKSLNNFQRLGQNLFTHFKFSNIDMSSNKPFEMGSWYPYLEKFTFESRFIPLSAEEGLSIQYHFEQTYKHERGKFTPKHEQILIQLENKVNLAITNYKQENNCKFFFLLPTK